MPLLPDSAKYDLALQLQACQSKSRRNGKVARLPEAVRQQINQMIDDGFPYKVIIANLGEVGKHLNEDNLSNWRLGGYQDYLNAQSINDRARTQVEAAADLIRETGNEVDPAKLQQVCTQMALLSYLETLRDHGDQLARDSLKQNPAKFITLINACSNMANANIAIEKSKWRSADLQSANRSSPAAPISNPPATPPAGTSTHPSIH